MQKMSEIIVNDELLSFKCPHCDLPIDVVKTDLNCCIFRHGIYKNTFKQVDPHLNKAMCDKLVENKMVIGCCKPFEIVNKNNKYFVQKCDYK